MRWILGAAAALTMLPVGAGADARAILYDAVALNIGVNCQWQTGCMRQQRSAMKQALAYVARERPAQWRGQQWNRNAGRGPHPVDPGGYGHCLRNPPSKPAGRKSKGKWYSSRREVLGA